MKLEMDGVPDISEVSEVSTISSELASGFSVTRHAIMKPHFAMPALASNIREGYAPFTIVRTLFQYDIERA